MKFKCVKESIGLTLGKEYEGAIIETPLRVQEAHDFAGFMQIQSATKVIVFNDTDFWGTYEAENFAPASMPDKPLTEFEVRPSEGKYLCQRCGSTDFVSQKAVNYIGDVLTTHKCVGCGFEKISGFEP